MGITDDPLVWFCVGVALCVAGVAVAWAIVEIGKLYDEELLEGEEVGDEHNG